MKRHVSLGVSICAALCMLAVWNSGADAQQIKPRKTISGYVPDPGLRKHVQAALLY